MCCALTITCIHEFIHYQVDIFSYGITIIHVLSGKWPIPSEPIEVNPDDPDDLIAVSEFDRRKENIKIISKDHPLLPLIKRCVSNSSSHRPTSADVLQQMYEIAEENMTSFTNKIEMLEWIKTLETESKDLHDQIDELKARNLALVEERVNEITEESQSPYANRIELLERTEGLQKEINNLILKNDAKKEVPIVVGNGDQLKQEKSHTIDNIINPPHRHELTVEEVATQAGIKLEDLDKECHRAILLKLADTCDHWELIGQHLGLSTAQITAINDDNGYAVLKRLGVFQKWKERFAHKATYKVLVKALLSCGKAQQAIDVCNQLCKQQGQYSVGRLSYISVYLRHGTEYLVCAPPPLNSVWRCPLGAPNLPFM